MVINDASVERRRAGKEKDDDDDRDSVERVHVSCSVVCSEEPQFPACVFLGLGFGLAFGRGGVGLLRVRQRGEGRVLDGAQPPH